MPTAIRLGPEFAAHLRAREPLRFGHELTDRAELDRAAIAALAERLGAGAVVREAGVKPLVYADGGTAPTLAEAIGDAVRQLETNDAWLTLLNVERDPAYCALIDEQLDGLAAAAGLPPRGWRQRMGFVFASSPHSVTGAHFDVEHSLLLQLRGRRVLGFGEFASAATRKAEVHRYWSRPSSYGKLVEMPVPRREITVEPGIGVYIPPYTPHWLQNGDAASLSLTVTFFNRDNERETRVQICNERLRRLGLDPRPYRSSAFGDLVKLGLMRARVALPGWRR